MIKLGLLHVKDPQTGLATLPVAIVGWDTAIGATAVSWLPSNPARHARKTLEQRIDLDWITTHSIPTDVWVEELGEGSPFDPLDIQVERRARDHILMAGG